MLENDLVLEDVAALAHDVGFTGLICKLDCVENLTLDEYLAPRQSHAFARAEISYSRHC